MALKRSRTVRGESSRQQEARIDPDLQVPGWERVVITTQEQKQRMLNLITRQVIPTRFIHHPTLISLGIDKHVEKLFKGVGMSGFFNMHYDTYNYLTLKFVSSFNVIKSNALISHVQFRLFNNNVRLTLKEFSKLFELKSDRPLEPPQDNIVVVYQSLTGDPNLNLQHAKGTWIQHPVPKIWQQFFGLTIFGRHEPANVRRDELELLGSYMIP